MLADALKVNQSLQNLRSATVYSIVLMVYAVHATVVSKTRNTRVQCLCLARVCNMHSAINVGVVSWASARAARCEVSSVALM